ncbi:MAG TPA: ABC transporter permease [Bryobacteraceae bacterium]|nr:ABC transporter permease [Bryobacteraceae bacterium]
MSVETQGITSSFEETRAEGARRVAAAFLSSLLVMSCAVAIYVVCASLVVEAPQSPEVRASASRPGVEVFHDAVESRGGQEFSFAEWNAVRRVAGLAAIADVPLNVGAAGNEQLVPVGFVSAGYFRDRGMDLAPDSGFTCANDDSAEPCPEAILERGLARELFGTGAPSSIRVNGRWLRVRGVVSNSLPPGRVSGGLDAPRIWIPISSASAVLGRDWIGGNSNHNLMVVGRSALLLRPQAEEHQIDEALRRAARTLPERPAEVTVVPAPQAALTHALRLSGSGAGALVRYASGLGLVLIAVCAAMAYAIAWRSARQYFDEHRVNRFGIVIWVGIALGLTSAALGILGAVPLLRLATIMAEAHRLPFEAPAISPGIAAAAALVCGAAGIVFAAVRNRIGSFRLYLPVSAAQLYWALSFIVVALIAIGATNGILLGDFWDHGAAVRELMSHPTDPSHPIFNLRLPHQFFSPYSLAVAALSRTTGLSAVDGLRLAGVINVLALFTTFYLFAVKMFRNPRTALYGILFVLLLWGPAAWNHSGFLHFNSLVQTAAFPSTFVSALTFLIWYCALLLEHRPLMLVSVIAPLMLVALISHPLTSIAMMMGLAAIAVGREYRNRGRLAIAAAVLLTFAGAALWPLFPFYGLLTQSPRWDLDANWMYSNYGGILLRIFPALVGLPVVVRRLMRNPRDFIGLTFCGLLLVYLLGGITGKYVVGRVLPFALLMLQLSLAHWLAQAADDAAPSGFAMRRGLLALTLVCGLTMLPGIASSLPLWQNSYGEFRFLSSRVKPSETVLTDEQSSLKEPAFGGRVVAFTRGHTVGFVPDLAARNEDRDRFFEPGTSDGDRRRIIGRYQVQYVLINRREVTDWPSVLMSVERMGRIDWWDGDMILVSVRA